MSAIRIGEDLVHYEVLGRGGRPVILVHGWMGSWRYWIPTMRSLQVKYRVYAVDLFGFGDSTKNPARYTMDQQLNLIEELMRELALEKVAMVAHGLGAYVALEFARLRPEKVARLLLVSAPLFDPGDLATRVPPDQPVMLTPPTSERERILQTALAAREALSVPSSYNPLRDTLNGTMEMLLSRCFKKSETEYDKIRGDLHKSDDRVLAATSKDFDAGRVLDTIRSLKSRVPMGVVHGVNDPLVPVPSEQMWSYMIAGKEEALLPVPLEGVRHFPMLESEIFQRLVGQFLETSDISRIEVKERWRRPSR